MAEALPKVWSERRPGTWDQCTEGAYLMALVYGGFRGFPAGIYSDLERNALDDATPPDPASGGSTFDLLDTGANRRYGFTLHRIPDGSMAGLRRQLRTPGQALAVAGRLSHLPAGHRLRRWQPSYTGGHAICVVTLGEDKVWWGDPLAPMQFEGDQVSVQAVLDFAWYPNDARIIVGGAYAVDGLRSRIRRLRNTRETLTIRIQELEAMPSTPELRTKLLELQSLVDRLLLETEE